MQFNSDSFQSLPVVFDIFNGEYILATKKGAAQITKITKWYRVRETYGFPGFGSALLLAINFMDANKSTPDEKINDVLVTAYDRNLTFFINDPIQTLKPLPAKSTITSIIKIKRHPHTHGF